MLSPLGLSAQETVCYGYAPRNPQPDDMAAHGTGMNNYIEGAICLDPASDPMLDRLKGSSVVGVRCFVRADYKQKSKKWSCVWTRQGSLAADANNQYENLAEGWNEVMFKTPVTLTGEPLYVGYQVFETKGTPYPIVSYSKASVNDGFYINMDQNGFEKYDSRGTLLIEAIIQPAGEVGSGAFVQASGWPMAVAPDAPFDCNLYIRSQSAEPLTSVEVTTTTDDGATTHAYTLHFDTPVPAFDGVLVPYTLNAPHSEGESVEMTLMVTAINGTPCQPGKVNGIRLYVTDDAFVRTPLIEEFTGLSCVNCPFMAYYLDQALEEVDHVYVAHHAGFQDDKLTLTEDKALLFLFGGPATFNPAAMYDRRLIPSCNRGIPPISAQQPSVEPYRLCIDEAMAFPAKANVKVDVTADDAGRVTCRVHGKIAKAMVEAAAGIRLTAYLVEDGIKPDGDYRQNGVSANVADDAPADMVARFRHNGLIRIAFTGNLGNPIEVDADGYFDATFTQGYIRPMNAAIDTWQDAVLAKAWVKRNMRAVAFVHKLNTDVTGIEDNFVLNAAQTPLVATDDGIDATPSTTLAPPAAYDLQGRPAKPGTRGIVICNGKVLGF